MLMLLLNKGARGLVRVRDFVIMLSREFKAYCGFLFYYARKKILSSSFAFEKNKNQLVKFFMMKRGRYNRPFLHLTTMAVLGVGVLIGPFLADNYPLATNASTLKDIQPDSTANESIIVGENVFHTEFSDKPRSKILTYTVQKGDTISTIAKKFNISVETIKWENDLISDSLSIGDELRILPVSGVAHKVSNGETIYTIAKKYDTDPQKIVDFPFNDFANPETFALVSGQMLIVPDGIKPTVGQPAIRRQVYIAQGPVAVSPGGFTFPVHGELSQFYSWYHPGIDIAAPYGSPIVAAHNGTVTKVILGTYDGGYGNNVYVDNGSGVESHYAHMTGSNVSVGQHVVGGSTVVGWIGMSGRTTGPHLHFEIRQNGVLVNPLPLVQ